MERTVYIKSYKAPELNNKEIFRYARSGDDEQAASLLGECIDEAWDILSYKVCFRRFKIKREGGGLDLGFAFSTSRSLSRCLDGCDEIILFAATVGVSLDRLIARYNVASPAKAIMLQALGSERVEALCDEFCKDISVLESEKGNALRPRFSPGYGDLSLEMQREIFSALDCTKNIGISLSDGLFMTPIKSVTAIIGIYSK